jgi:ribosomal protein S18 acetylase RimI-like enzyme
VAFALSTPRVDDLGAVVRALREWQHDAAPMQLHPGDLGWFWRFGAEATAAAVRSWSRDGRVMAIGLLDGPGLVRLTTAPEVRRDAGLARRIIADVADPENGVLPPGTASVEAPEGSVVGELLLDAGWRAGEAWTPLSRDLTEPVEGTGLRIEAVGPQRAMDHVAVHRSAFASTTFTVERWSTMATGLPYRNARCLVGYDERGDAVAVVAVWSAGPGRPGLLEPLGVHAEHRRRGHGTAICLAAAAALQRMRASRAIVCTPSANTSAIATYASAGFQAGPQRRDRTRPAMSSCAPTG